MMALRLIVVFAPAITCVRVNARRQIARAGDLSCAEWAIENRRYLSSSLVFTLNLTMGRRAVLTTGELLLRRRRSMRAAGEK